jgi:predicted nucleic acid-binding protein
MYLVDSCGWLEYFTNGTLADEFAFYLKKDRKQLLVPTLIVYEVYKFLRRTVSEEAALQAVSRMRVCRLVDLDTSLALEAADLSLLHRLAMADAIVYATARRFQAQLVTSDGDFKHLDGVRHVSKGA